jgi:hypothetical protein
MQMSTTMERIRNGVDTETLFATLDAVKAQPELGTSSSACQPLDRRRAQPLDDQDFYAAGGEDTSRPRRSSSTPASPRS